MHSKTGAVFGGSGKIGRRVIGLLSREGFRVRALKHLGSLPAEVAVTVEGSVAEPDAVREVVQGADVVVQMATTKEDPRSFFDITIRGTLNILEACRKERIRQFILLGGDAAFGIWFYPQPIPIDETHPHAAYPGYYAFTKVMEEVMAQQYAIQYRLPLTILRSSWVFEKDDLLNHFSLLKNVNPEEKGHGFGVVTPEVQALINAREERIPILTNSEGTPYRRHIVHIDDVLQCLRKMLVNPSAIGQSFNVAAPAAFSYDVVAAYLSRKTGIPSIRLACPGYHPFEVNISKARAVLGYAPENDIFRIADRALAYRRGEDHEGI
jgi:nucleoside-diphosphate-sugar epimerase